MGLGVEVGGSGRARAGSGASSRVRSRSCAAYTWRPHSSPRGSRGGGWHPCVAMPRSRGRARHLDGQQGGGDLGVGTKAPPQPSLRNPSGKGAPLGRKGWARASESAKPFWIAASKGALDSAATPPMPSALWTTLPTRCRTLPATPPLGCALEPSVVELWPPPPLPPSRSAPPASADERRRGIGATAAGAGRWPS